MKKLIILTILLTGLTGCIKQEESLGTITSKHFEKGDIKVTVGGEMLGATDTTFIPEVKLTKWDETSIRLWSEEKGDKKAIQKDNKISWNNKDKSKEYNFYEVSKEELGNEDGGFEYEIILNEKPKSNVTELKIETENLVFYYQAPLNEEEQDELVVSCTETQCFNKDGKVIVERPENIIGSYAVYHKDDVKGDYSRVGGKNYKAGKAFHIYRPQMIDANGNKTWGKLNINIAVGIVSVTIPQEFLDNATYPVRHATGYTFGYETAGSTKVQGYQFTAYRFSTGASPTQGVVTTCTVSFACPQFVGCGMLCGLYTVSSNVPGTPISGSGVNGPGAGALAGKAWRSEAVDMDIDGSTEYFITTYNYPQNDYEIYKDTGDANYGRYIVNWANLWDNNPTTTGSTVKISVYLTYDEYVPPAPPASQSSDLTTFN